ncbi:hypothetical protein [Rhodanobacter sp. KK11]|jgi:hypothetical protein|nr:hypothetical protein [Rhodanobacter sp. KK11]MDW2982293.1 hypothetical protein [Rhodanobacter sp. KK11]
MVLQRRMRDCPVEAKILMAELTRLDDKPDRLMDEVRHVIDEANSLNDE